MKKLRIGINGFGRIGRNAARIILDRPDVELTAINSRADTASHAYLLSYDSTYGTLNKHVEAATDALVVDGKKIAVYRADDPSSIPWKDVDVVLESSGKFRTKDDAKGHLKNSKYVVVSAPAKDDMKTLVMGVNETDFDPRVDSVVSNSSCTTNCLSTTVKVLHESFTIQKGFMTTVHAVTDSQNLLDNSHKKEARLRRSAFASIIPASTGSAKDIGKLYKELAGKIVCKALRVPTLTGSLIDLTVEVEKSTSIDAVNSAFKTYADGELKGILAVSPDELVSHDYVGSIYSSVVDTYLTGVQGGTLIKVYAWYDNEWGYTNRLVDMATYIGKKAGITK